MSKTRISIPDFQTANKLYVGATVSIFTVDENGAKTATLATLYDAPTGAGTLANPQTLDSEGKFRNPVYIDEPVIMSIGGLSVDDHDTGVIATPGTFRGAWQTDTLYYAGDVVRDGANGNNTRDWYWIVSQHVSGTWAADKDDATKMVLALDASLVLVNLDAAPGDFTALDYIRVNAGQNEFEGRAPGDVATDIGISAFGKTLVDDADAAAARTTLGLGTAATENVAAGGSGGLLRADGKGSQLTGILPRSYLAGLGTSRASATSIDVAAGECRDDTDDSDIVLSAGTINLATTGANGLDTGSLANNTWYHVFAISKADGADPARLASTSLTPTMPTDYTLKRRIGSFRTNGSAEVIDFTQRGDEFLWKSPIRDVVDTSTQNSRVLRTLTVPSGVQVLAHIYIRASAGNVTSRIYITSPDVNDETISTTDGRITQTISPGSTHELAHVPYPVRTNTSSQVRSAGENLTQIDIGTIGWIDRRGRDS